MPHRPSTVLADWKHRLWSSSQGNLKQTQRPDVGVASSNGTKFSALVGGTISGPRGVVQRKAAQALKARQNTISSNGGGGGGDFKVGEVEAGGKRSVRSLQGVRRDSEVIYVGTFSSNGDAGKRGKIADVFDVENGGSDDPDGSRMYGTMSRSLSQPDFLARESRSSNNSSNPEDISEEVMLQRPSGLFDRPMLGSLAFR